MEGWLCCRGLIFEHFPDVLQLQDLLHQHTKPMRAEKE